MTRANVARGSRVGDRPAETDLIVDAWADEAIHRQLSPIAPTVEVKLDNTDSWQSAQRLAGRALGREVDAEATIAETDAIVAAERRRLAVFAALPAVQAGRHVPLDMDTACYQESTLSIRWAAPRSPTRSLS